MNKPLILITNDDGYNALGLSSLVEAVKDLGELLVVAPDRPQSGMGHAITVNEPLRCYPIDFFENIKVFCCTGTPVDCVKMGLYQLNDRKPDLILSGINHGSNVSTNVLYSGTMSAAVEGALEGIKSIGFSLTNYSSEADFTASREMVTKITKNVLENGLKEGTCLNVNVPDVPLNKIKGIKVCRQGRAFWDDTFEKRVDPLGKDYFWLTGSFGSSENKPNDSDVFYLENNYVTIVPTQFDMTCHSTIEELKKQGFEL
tara:strand:+ start:2602 stop:3375 length:774 start_codon:yes stop_codon:yes gene_type:complete